jgi:Na+/H+-translocating membrane pyrophosphatase
MSDNTTIMGRITGLFSSPIYFSGLEEVAYFMGLLALLLAIVQFGLPYSFPYMQKFLGVVFKRFRTDNSIQEVSVMINKILGLSAFLSLFLFIFLFIYVLFKAVMTITLFVGYLLNSGVALLITAALIGLVSSLYFKFFRKVVNDISIKSPKSETELLSRNINNLGSQVHNLVIKIDQQTDAINRLVNHYEKNNYPMQNSTNRHKRRIK